MAIDKPEMIRCVAEIYTIRRGARRVILIRAPLDDLLGQTLVLRR
jgi:hypothetical protein